MGGACHSKSSGRDLRENLGPMRGSRRPGSWGVPGPTLDAASSCFDPLTPSSSPLWSSRAGTGHHPDPGGQVPESPGPPSGARAGPGTGSRSPREGGACRAGAAHLPAAAAVVFPADDREGGLAGSAEAAGLVRHPLGRVCDKTGADVRHREPRRHDQGGRRWVGRSLWPSARQPCPPGLRPPWVHPWLWFRGPGDPCGRAGGLPSRGQCQGSDPASPGWITLSPASPRQHPAGKALGQR